MFSSLFHSVLWESPNSFALSLYNGKLFHSMKFHTHFRYMAIISHQEKSRFVGGKLLVWHLKLTSPSFLWKELYGSSAAWKVKTYHPVRFVLCPFLAAVVSITTSPAAHHQSKGTNYALVLKNSFCKETFASRIPDMLTICAHKVTQQPNKTYISSKQIFLLRQKSLKLDFLWLSRKQRAFFDWKWQVVVLSYSKNGTAFQTYKRKTQVFFSTRDGLNKFEIVFGQRGQWTKKLKSVGLHPEKARPCFDPCVQLIKVLAISTSALWEKTDQNCLNLKTAQLRKKRPFWFRCSSVLFTHRQIHT